MLPYKAVEIFEVVFIKGIADDFNVQLIEILMAQGALEIWCQGRFNKDRVVEFFDVGGNAENGHGFEPA